MALEEALVGHPLDPREQLAGDLVVEGRLVSQAITPVVLVHDALPRAVDPRLHEPRVEHQGQGGRDAGRLEGDGRALHAVQRLRRVLGIEPGPLEVVDVEVEDRLAHVRVARPVHALRGVVAPHRGQLPGGEAVGLLARLGRQQRAAVDDLPE